ncbi:uncharacterized protein ASCRUDRAFT_74056 [Ascoidea rubescens DSM 1968]|uniref:Uncharacterized protein n=1 Tax=Ascoidea rubescens DSM 1968 TaxID=1344418 RepID=A0A1D2VS32_9ASCO|nr:hypothetical protein ASCRUDRAFT_74056 [Ascoidea rubescens DSM 1968]ODV64432.1 hypothetical protein ASCRUDRAFT_74056 [Ascoidea rubescens DSM 1968]
MKLLSSKLTSVILLAISAVLPAVEAYPIPQYHRRDLVRYKRSVPNFHAQYTVPPIYEKI